MPVGEPREVICEGCGEPFVALRKDARFCAECKARRAVERATAWNRANRERRREIASRYNRSTKGLANAARAYARAPEKFLARNRAHRALERGEITREGCEVCGAPAEMHHDDYSKPLEVRWFCRAHHRALH